MKKSLNNVCHVIRAGLIVPLFFGVISMSQAVAQDSSAIETEADEVRTSCYSTNYLRSEIDCECLATTFAEKRLELGPDQGKEGIIASITRTVKCLNFPSLQRQEYAQCISKVSSEDTNGIELEQYCQCQSRKMVETLAQHKGKYGASVKGSASFGATMYCRKKEAYP
ncbi:MAG: hypothetical protein COA75_08395 [Cellvibrionales bacterium]|nr:MAG: hypothetical protein COA75_08395 [Cellvibrionales bacterium]